MAWKEASHWWWFGSRKSSRQSPWLEATLSELDDKTKAMLKLIEGDADSFAQRAEMYYKKRPELVGMVEDFYRAYRSLAERYDLIKSDPGTRLVTALGSPFASTKYQSDKFNGMDPNFDSCSESLDSENYAMSEVADPEHESQTQVDGEIEEIVDPEPKDQVVGDVCNDEVLKLREEIARLKEGNKILVHELMKKDAEIKVTKEYEILSEACDNEPMRLTGRFDRLKETGIQRDQLMWRDDEKKETKPDDVPSEVPDDEGMKLREEIETLEEENRIQRDQLMQMDEEKREIKNAHDDKVKKLREEIERLKEENRIQRDQLIMQTDEQKREIEHARDDEVKKLREEIERLKEENRIQRDQLIMQTDEEKRETENARDDEVKKLWEKIETLKEENKIQRDKLIQDNKMIKAMESKVRTLEDVNRIQKDKLMQAEEQKRKMEKSGIEVMRLREEIERLRKENNVQRDQIMQNDEKKRDADECLTKMRDGNSRLTTENKMQRVQLMQKDDEKRMVIRQLSVAVGLLKDADELEENNEEKKDVDEYFTIMLVEIKRLRKENQIQNEELMQKDEEKREVIRQLSLALGLLKDENLKLRNCIVREHSSKKRNPFEFSKLTAELSRKLFKVSSRSAG